MQELAPEVILSELELVKTSNPSLAKVYLVQLDGIKEELNQQQMELFKLYTSHSLAIQGQYSDAENLLIELADSSSDIYIVSRAYSMLSNVFAYEGKFQEAFIYSAKSLNDIEKLSDKNLHKFAVLQNAASLFKLAGLDNKAMEYSRQLIRIAEAQNDPLRLCAANYEMVSWELKHNSTVMAQSRVDNLLEHCENADDLLLKLLSAEVQAQLLLLNKKPIKAVDVLLEWQDEVEEVGYRKFKSLYETRLSEAYQEQGKYDEALTYGLSAYSVAKELNDIGMLIETCKILASVYSKLDELEESVKYYQEYIDYEKQLRFITNKRKMAYYMVSMKK
ncbi:MAG TPA: tetratricopeptide repeat protein [Kangiella sp.]